MMLKRWHIITLCVVAGACRGAIAQSEELHSIEPPLPAAFVREHIKNVEAKIATLTPRITTAHSPERALLEAERNLLLIARRLLHVGQSANDRGALSIMYGLTIANHSDQLRPVIAPLPRMVTAALQAKPSDPNEVSRLIEVAEAIKQFNLRCNRSVMSLERADATSVDAYLHQHFQPLAVAVAGLNQPRPASTWVLPSESFFADGEAVPAVSPERFDELVKRFANAQLTSDTKTELEETLNLCKQGWQRPELRPYVAVFFRELMKVANIQQTLENAKWLDSEAFAHFQAQLHTAVLLLRDPRTRESAQLRLDQLNRIRKLTQQITQLVEAGGHTPVEGLRPLFMVIHELHADPNQHDIANQLANTFGRIAETASGYRRMQRQVLPVDIRRPFQAAEREYRQLEADAMTQLIRLTTDPLGIDQPQWSTLVDELDRRARLMHQLNSVPEWLTRVSTLNPVAARALFTRLRQIGVQVTDPQYRADAIAALNGLEQQLGLFEALPFEDEFSQRQSPMRIFTQQQHEKMAQQLMVLRSQWAAAWGAGTDPTIAGNRLLLLRDLMSAMHDGLAMLQAADTLAKLNRWAAWEIDAHAIEPIKAWLPSRLRLACELAGRGAWDDLALTLERIDQQVPVARVIASLSRSLDGALGDVPGGFSGMLGQCLYPPDINAFGQDQRTLLAQLCVYLTAAEFARQQGQISEAEKLMVHCGTLARRALSHWQQTPPELYRPPAPPASEKQDPLMLDI